MKEFSIKNFSNIIKRGKLKIYLPEKITINDKMNSYNDMIYIMENNLSFLNDESYDEVEDPFDAIHFGKNLPKMVTVANILSNILDCKKSNNLDDLFKKIDYIFFDNDFYKNELTDLGIEKVFYNKATASYHVYKIIKRLYKFANIKPFSASVNSEGTSIIHRFDYVFQTSSGDFYMLAIIFNPANLVDSISFTYTEKKVNLKGYLVESGKQYRCMDKAAEFIAKYFNNNFKEKISISKSNTKIFNTKTIMIINGKI